MILVVYLGHGIFHPVSVLFFSKPAFFGRGLNSFTTGNPFSGTKFLGCSIETDSGALKGIISSEIEETSEKSGAPLS